MKQMSAQSLAPWLAEHEDAILIDVRETHELVNGMLDGAVHIPMNHIPGSIDELVAHKASPMVLICRSGYRSMQVGYFLEQAGFTDIINLEDGMNGWAAKIDTNMKVY
ncbi:Rhodanese [Methylophaga frappieri]|uniref:Rhodanese n=1 Tax=Methylophaga frappieri (strain ATCC BAA-2434 / DSM 25690 / JAM7) TaxID=754477 RepID=I1YI05_METFJ|nr:rhodanese-like domain-containing protein [Methylophaga frappieri]AFJ02548.1 Rhodanese [Methylophaga frappieri]